MKYTIYKLTNEESKISARGSNITKSRLTGQYSRTEIQSLNKKFSIIKDDINQCLSHINQGRLRKSNCNLTKWNSESNRILKISRELRSDIVHNISITRKNMKNSEETEKSLNAKTKLE